MKNMLVRVDGELGLGVTPKDVVLAIIGKIGTAGGTGYAIEFGGEVFRNMSMEGRLTVCNMAIEAGARAGMVAVDDITIDYVKGRPFAPKSVVELNGADIEPQVSWGTSPEMVVGVNGSVPNPTEVSDSVKAAQGRR